MLATLVLTGSLAIAAPPPPFIAESTADERVAGSLVALRGDGSADIAGADRITTVRDVITLRRALPLPPMPRGPLLVTTTGDRIPGDLRGGDDRSLQFQPAFTRTKWNVPLSAAVVVWLVKPPAETPLEPDRYSWLPEKRNRDILRFRNGDILPGTIDGFEKDKETLRFKPESRAVRTIPFEELAAIAFNPSLSRSRPIKGAYVRLVLRDGARIGAAMPTTEAGILKLRTLYGRAIEIPIVELVSLDVLQGKAVYLADRKPKAVEQTGFLGTEWKWQANKNTHGQPLRLLTAEGEPSTFDRGLGTHPRTVLTYDLGGKYRRFEAWVGLDAVTGKRGQAAVRIFVDGEELKSSKSRVPGSKFDRGMPTTDLTLSPSGRGWFASAASKPGEGPNPRNKTPHPPSRWRETAASPQRGEAGAGWIDEIALVKRLRSSTWRLKPATSNPLRPGPARLLRIDLTGAKELKLLVDFGPDGDVQADVDWGDARLVE
ncbi:MAG TPA: NPCBM/NEW2 domain-containing protein [Urbifossiella sp.]|nr:NPCBM/NEW2 domain-containing protein [Urbifossiella sp.]